MTRNPRIWHPEDIKAALRKKFGTMAALSLSWGLHRDSVTNVLRRPFNSMKLERRIAEVLEVPLWELWPERWNQDGTAKPRSIEMNRKRAADRPERQKRAAA